MATCPICHEPMLTEQPHHHLTVTGPHRQSTHWEGCWRAHHECAVHLLDKILRDEALGAVEARRRLAEAREWATECEEFGCHDDGTGPL